MPNSDSANAVRHTFFLKVSDLFGKSYGLPNSDSANAVRHTFLKVSDLFGKSEFANPLSCNCIIWAYPQGFLGECLYQCLGYIITENTKNNQNAERIKNLCCWLHKGIKRNRITCHFTHKSSTSAFPHFF
ncbi:MAG TPA: hypothetical protein PLL35_03490 [Candidatus Cloacimonas sp.]|nr:hypothetical protein [Candidatus Cloacimonas sp.]